MTFGELKRYVEKYAEDNDIANPEDLSLDVSVEHTQNNLYEITEVTSHACDIILVAKPW